MVVHFYWYGDEHLCKHDMTMSMIRWLIRDVQMVVAMVTRSVISSSEQFSAVQHVETITILFFCYNLLRLSPQCLHFTNTIGLQILRG